VIHEALAVKLALFFVTAQSSTGAKVMATMFSASATAR